MGGTADEFPLLSALGLYAADIRGDGNCLFNALSDQLYGHQNEHANIRARVIAYMREHADYYKQFIDVHPGGGIRRNPKRKNAGAYSTPATFVPPTTSDIDRVFESHLASMARGGTYGDNMEITAFASAFEYDVKIYQRDFAFIVSTKPDEHTRPVAHIAYHMWEHYSSIRNLDGPHQGPPNVQTRVLSPEEELQQKERLAQAPQVLPWQIDVVERSLPYLADKITIKRALEAARGNIDAAVSSLLDAEENGSVTSSFQESSSVERDQDSDDDVHLGPKKRQDRRISRVSRGGISKNRRSVDSRHALSQLTNFAGSSSQESFASVDGSSNWDSETSSMYGGRVDGSAGGSTQPSSVDESPVKARPSSHRESDDHHQPHAAPDGSADPDTITVSQPTTSTSNPAPDAVSSSQQSSSAQKPRLRLKLLPPRPPDHSATSATGKAGSGPHPPAVKRITAREKKDMKKLAQKAARKERQQAAIKSGNKSSGNVMAAGRDAATSEMLAGKENVAKNIPMVETLRTLYI